MRRPRAGDERTPQPPGGDGAPPGGNRTSRQELADRGPTRANAELVAESAARCIVRRRDGAPKGAASSQKEGAQSNYLTRLLGAPSPRISEGDERDNGVPGAAKNTGDFAWLFENRIGRDVRPRNLYLSSRATERSEGGPGSILRSLPIVHGVWVPAFAGTTIEKLRAKYATLLPCSHHPESSA
jgi:hypothetical protein